MKSHATCAPLLRIALLTIARLGKYCDASVIPIITEIAEKSKDNLHVLEVIFFSFSFNTRFFFFNFLFFSLHNWLSTPLPTKEKEN